MGAYDFGPNHPLRPDRLVHAVELLRLCGVWDGPATILDPGAGDEADILRVHDAAYLNAVRDFGDGTDCSKSHLSAFGFGPGDNPAFPNMHEASMAYVAGTAEAARSVVGGAPLAFGLGGGLHHAHRARASGFCIYDDPAIACSILRDHFSRVAYIDIDVHHGDGVQFLFYDDPTVLTCSIHEDPRTLFPGTGSVDETGVSYSAINVPVPAGATGDTWLFGFEHGLLPALQRFQPEAIVLQMGTDTHSSDPLAHLKVTVQEWIQAVETIRDLNTPIVALGGGGYNRQAVPRMWAAAVITLLGLEVPPTIPSKFAEVHGVENFFDASLPGPREAGIATMRETVEWLQKNHHPKIGLPRQGG